jgi:hypothetical protein
MRCCSVVSCPLIQGARQLFVSLRRKSPHGHLADLNVKTNISHPQARFMKNLHDLPHEFSIEGVPLLLIVFSIRIYFDCRVLWET